MDTLSYFFLAALAVVVIAVLVTRAIVRSRLQARSGDEKARLETELSHLQGENERLKGEMKAF